MGERRDDSMKRVLTLIGVAVVLVYARPVFFGEVFFRRDISRYIHPLFEQVRARLAAGELPLWSPAEMGGTPLLGDVSGATLYPPNLLLAWLAPSIAISVLIVLHHALAAVGATLLLRRWGAPARAAVGAGTTLSLAGYLVAMDNSMIYLVGVCWGPWVLWALDRLLERTDAPRVATLAAVFALLFTSGELQFTYLCVLIAGAYALVFARPRARGVGALAVAGVAALGLSALQLLPLASVVAASTRVGGLETATAQDWALHPVRLVELFSAHPFGVLAEQTFWGQAFVNSPLHTTPWSNGLYVGAAVPWLALLAPRDRRSHFLWALGLLAVLLAMGPHTPLDGWFRRLLPLWSAFRYPEKLMAVATLALCLVAGRGLGRLLDTCPRAALPCFAVATGLALLIALWLSLAPAPLVAVVDRLLVAVKTGHVDRPAALGMLTASAWRSAGMLLCATLLVLAGRRQLGAPGLRAWGWIALLVLDVGSANARLIETAPASLYASPSPIGEALATEAIPTSPQRVYRLPLRFPRPPQLPTEHLNLAHQHWMRQTLAPKTGSALPQVRYASGYSASMSARFERFWSALSRVGDGRVLDLMAVGHLIDNQRQPLYRDRPGDRVVMGDAGLDARLVALAEPTPMARVVYDVIPVVDDEGALRELSRGDLQVRHTAVVEGAAQGGGFGRSPRAPAAATFLADLPEELELEATVQGDSGALLVVSAAHDPKWRAWVDGRPVPLLRVNYLQQGVALAPGKHRIRLAYEDGTVLPGALISMLTLLALLAAIVARAQPFRPKVKPE